MRTGKSKWGLEKGNGEKGISKQFHRSYFCYVSTQFLETVSMCNRNCCYTEY